MPESILIEIIQNKKELIAMEEKIKSIIFKGVDFPKMREKLLLETQDAIVQYQDFEKEITNNLL